MKWPSYEFNGESRTLAVFEEYARNLDVSPETLTALEIMANER